MFGRPKKGWIGVDLGEGAVKIAQLVRKGNRLSLANCAAAERSLAGEGPVAERLRAASLLAEGLRGRQAAATLSMSSTKVQATDEDYLPADGETVASWSAGPNSNYTLSTASQTVDQAVETLGEYGWHCEVVDGPPLTIARVLQLSPGYEATKLLGAIDWGETTVTYVAAKGGQALYARVLRCKGIGSLRKNVAEALGLTLEEAEEAMLSCHSGRSDQTNGASKVLSSALRDAARPVLNELSRTKEHLEGKLKCRAPESVFLMGAAGTVPLLGPIVSSAVGVVCKPWTAAGLDRKAKADDLPDCLLAQAIGLSALAWETA